MVEVDEGGADDTDQAKSSIKKSELLSYRLKLIEISVTGLNKKFFSTRRPFQAHDQLWIMARL